MSAPPASTPANAPSAKGVMEYTPPPYFDPKSSRVPTWLQPWIADTFSFVMIHYNLWIIPVIAVFYYLYHVRLCACLLALVWSIVRCCLPR